MIHRFLVASVGIAVVFGLAVTGASQRTSQEKNNTEATKPRADDTSRADAKKGKAGAEAKAKSKPKIEKATLGADASGAWKPCSNGFRA